MEFNKVLEEGGDTSLDYGFKKMIAGKAELAKKDFGRYDDEIQKMALEVAEIDVAGDKDAGYLASILTAAAKLVKSLESERKRITGVAYDFYKTVMSFEKKYSEQVTSDIIGPGKRKLSDHERTKELERRKAEKAAREAAQRKQDQLDRDADDAGVARVALDTPVVMEERAPIRTESGSASVKPKWTFEITDPDKVPRKYCIPNYKAIKEAVEKTGVRRIAGVRIFEEFKTSLRTR